MKIGVLKNLAKFTGKHLCQRLFFNKVKGQACNFIKKALARLSPHEFCEIFKTTIYTEYHRTTAPGRSQFIKSQSQKTGFEKDV